MADRNMHQDWSKDIRVAFSDVRSKAKASNAVPFGQERLSPAESKAKLTSMSPQERERFISERGSSEVIKMLRGD